MQKESWQKHDEMIAISEEFYQSLDLPYRVVSIVAGALNDAAARKYDLEAWFPSYEAYRELVSCSNCTDYQSRDLNIRHGAPKMGEREKPFVHILNGTLTATERYHSFMRVYCTHYLLLHVVTELIYIFANMLTNVSDIF